MTGCCIGLATPPADVNKWWTGSPERTADVAGWIQLILQQMEHDAG